MKSAAFHLACCLGWLVNGRTGAAEKPLPAELAPYFQPPAGLAGDFGEHRPVLRFQDGREVKSAADWRARRKEILARWHELMGPWPALIEQPKLEILETTRRENFTQHKVNVEIAPRQSVPGYLLIPDGQGPFPAVLVPFYDAETGAGLAKPLRDFGYQLTKRGFVTLSIGSPGGDARKPDLGEARCQPLSFLAYAAANCANALASRREVDPKRIGVVGHSYGGKWAMFAACLNEIFACGVWSDPGVAFDEKRPNVNYWDPWYLGDTPPPKRAPGLPSGERPRTGAYKELIAGGHDLHELQALMAPRPFLVSGGSEDGVERWRTLNHARAVNRLLGFTDRVAMTNRPKHDPTEESNGVICRFFEHFLEAGRQE